MADNQVNARLWALYFPLTPEQFQSLRVVECCEFRDLMVLCANVKEADIPKHTKLHEEVMRSWAKWFIGLKQELQVWALRAVRWSQKLTHTIQVPLGHVSFTIDTWTDKPQWWSYICITAHWIGHNPQTKVTSLCSDILAFHHIPHYSHTWEGIVRVVLQLFDRAEVTSKVCTPTALLRPRHRL